MKNFQLNEFLHIKGIGSASGLIYYQNVLFIISDNSTFLYQYIIDKKLVLKFPLVDNPQENIPKKDKLDLEALTHFGNQLFIFGSGLLLCLFSPPFGLVWAFVQCFDVFLVLIMTGSFRFRCGSRWSIVLCDVIYP